MNNNFIPPQYSGNLVRVDEANFNGAFVSPPAGRWRAIHNTTAGNVTIKAPANQVLQYIAADGDNRSDVHGPNVSGNLSTGDDLIAIISNAELDTTPSESTGGTSGDVTVTRNGDSNPIGVTPPSFNGITTNADGDITAVVVNAEGSGLQTGDVLTFSFIDEDSTDTGDIITLTLVENNIELAAGFYALKAETAVTVLTLAAGDTVYVNLDKFEVDSTGNNAVITAYFG